MRINPLLLTDFYKQSHYKMYPEGTTLIYSNLTPRKSRISGIDKVVVFGIQYMILEYIVRVWNKYFFNVAEDEAVKEFKRIIDNTLGKDSVDEKHLRDLHKLQYLPLHIKSLPEGSLCDIRVPCLTIYNTVDHAYWLVNFLETIISLTVWMPMTSATLAFEYKKILTKYAIETGVPFDFVQWQGHDFSMRGMAGLEAACLSGAGHLTSFTGTDTIPAIAFLEDYYFTDVEKELIGGSVPATEHSVMCMGLKDDEIETFERLLDMYPSGILSVVSDTWDLWKVCTEIVPKLKDKILAREGKLVIRPDSGDPVDIICGYPEISYLPDAVKQGIKKFTFEGKLYEFDYEGYDNNLREYGEEGEQEINKFVNEVTTSKAEISGVVELLWDVFGGTVNEKGYKVLDPHIGAIYGDSITLDRAKDICERLKAKGFASSNIVLGIGSYTYQYNTRDTFGFAVKATYGEVSGVGREIFKDPITDDGTKKSAKGLLKVTSTFRHLPGSGKIAHDFYSVADEVSWADENQGELKTVFLNGKITNVVSLSEVRERLNKALKLYI